MIRKNRKVLCGDEGGDGGDGGTKTISSNGRGESY